MLANIALGLALAASWPPGAGTAIHRIDLSFSPIAIGTKLPRRDLKPIDDKPCPKGHFCNYIDAHHVIHWSAPWGDLAGKQIDSQETGARTFDALDIKALGIGRLRDEQSVVRQANAFLGDQKLTCRPIENMTNCMAQLNPGWLTLIFGQDHKLRLIRLSALNFP